MEFLLLGLLGVAGFLIIDNDDDDGPVEIGPVDPETPVVDPVVPVPEPVDPTVEIPQDPRPVETLSILDDELTLTAEDQVHGGQIIEARAGDDFVETADVTDVLVNGGIGDDLLVASNNNVVDGGAGNDRIFVKSDDARGFGGAGDDELIVTFGSSGEVFGGDGNDTLLVRRGTGVLNGDGGDDQLTLNGLGTANGGDGDDVFRALHSIEYSQEDMETLGPMELTGGEGADTFGILTNNKTDGGVRITDFNSDEDLLVFAFRDTAEILNEHDITITQDAEANTTTVRFTYDGSPEWGIATLDGLHDITVDDIGFVNDFVGIDDAIAGANFGLVNGTDGNDPLDVVAGDTVSAGAGDDVITLAQASSVSSNIAGEGGNDVISATGSGEVTITGGLGDDTINLDGELFGNVRAGDGDDLINVSNTSGIEETRRIPLDFVINAGSGDDIVNVADNSNATIYIGDGDDIANVGERSSVYGGGDGDDDVVNVTLTSDPSDFISRGALPAGDDTTFATIVRSVGAGDTVNISVTDPGTGSFHLINALEFYNQGISADQPDYIRTSQYLVWSPDPDADLTDLELNFGPPDSNSVPEFSMGFHVLAAYQNGSTVTPNGGGEPVITGIAPEVNLNVTISSVSAQSFYYSFL